MNAGSKPATPSLGVDQLIEDQEQLKRLDRSGIEVVVSTAAVVEMEAAKFLEMDQAGDDLLDADVGRVMPEIDEAARAVAEFLRRHVARAPVVHHG